MQPNSTLNLVPFTTTSTHKPASMSLQRGRSTVHCRVFYLPPYVPQEPAIKNGTNVMPGWPWCDLKKKETNVVPGWPWCDLKKKEKKKHWRLHLHAACMCSTSTCTPMAHSLIRCNWLRLHTFNQFCIYGEGLGVSRARAVAWHICSSP
jgi:hypothetical protein